MLQGMIILQNLIKSINWPFCHYSISINILIDYPSTEMTVAAGHRFAPEMYITPNRGYITPNRG